MAPLRAADMADPESRAVQYPHQFSGGMRQRAVIAAAMAGRPKLIIADEPTMALDVTVQAQVLDLIARRQRKTGAAVVLITHDLGVVAEVAQRVAVMYGGRIVETGAVRELFARPYHPHAAALLCSAPRIDAAGGRLDPIPGQPPIPTDLPRGCSFGPRCAISAGRQRCLGEDPVLRQVAAGSPLPLRGEGRRPGAAGAPRRGVAAAAATGRCAAAAPRREPLGPLPDPRGASAPHGAHSPRRRWRVAEYRAGRDARPRRRIRLRQDHHGARDHGARAGARLRGRRRAAARSALRVARRMFSRPAPALSLAYLLPLTAAALLAAPPGLDPLAQHLARMLEGPSRDHPFGTDELGRDILARAIWGARTSLTTAAGAVSLAAAIGVPMGLVAGFFGGWRDAVLMRVVDLLLAQPGIMLALALIAVLGRSQAAALVAVGLTGLPTFARVARAQLLSLRRRDFVTAVEAFGATPGDTLFRTVLANALNPILTQMVVLSSVAILHEGALAFLGVGIPPVTPSWSKMLRRGKEYFHESPTYAVLPGVVLTLTILAFDTIGRALSAVLEGHERPLVRPAANLP